MQAPFIPSYTSYIQPTPKPKSIPTWGWFLIAAGLVLFLGIVGLTLVSSASLKYKQVIHVTDLISLREHFLLDNPNLNGTDPTGGAVDYSYMFAKKSNGAIIPNINNDVSWQEIPENPELITNLPNGGVRLSLSKDLIPAGDIKVAGAPRLISRKLFRGGLFVFDVEHCPIGCGVWPALWLNGFVGGPDQYHEAKGTHTYKKSMAKLAKHLKPHECRESLVEMVKDPFLSEWLKRDVKVQMWPGGGEFDILEQTNFSNTNLVSIHGGPSCEVGNGFKNKYAFTAPKEYDDNNIRSVCGVTWFGNLGMGKAYGPDGKPLPQPKNSVLGPYSACGGKDYLMGKPWGGGSTTLPDGKTRENCPSFAGGNAGSTQVQGPEGSFGPLFNKDGGGVYVCQWIPKKTVKVWWYPRKHFSRDYLQMSGNPLSSNPNPNKWNKEGSGDIGGTDEDLILVASYILDDAEHKMTKNCDFNFQAIIINITLLGGWGAGAMNQYCSVDGLGGGANGQNYLEKCYLASPERAEANPDGAWDPTNQCYDGARSADFRGINAKPVFYSEAFMDIKTISVFQHSGDENIW